jgi:predicted MFS family arabinose efflux permease
MSMLSLFTFGIAGFCLFAAIQYWGTSLLTDEKRTTLIAVMNVAFRTGIALGVGLLFVKDRKISMDLFQISALFASIIILPSIFIRESMPVLPPRTQYTAPSKIIKHAAVPIICILVSNYVLLALSNFVVIYAIESGVEYKQALLINIYMVAGNLLFTIPISMMLDKLQNKTGSLIATLIIICCAVVLIPFVINNHYLTIAIFIVISAGIGTIYVIGVSMISAKFKKHNLATASTIMLIMNSVGGFAGVSTTGAAIEYWGNQGMIISVSILILFFLLFVIYSLNHDE